MPARREVLQNDNVDHASTPTLALPDERERDLRARTLSALLYALRDVDPSFIKNLVHSKINPQLAATQDLPANILDDLTSSPLENAAVPAVVKEDKPSGWLQHLNSVAQLVVREHEIVAVLSKRAGPGAHFSMVFTTDSSSDTDSDTDPAAIRKNGYILTRNPTRSPPPTIRKILDSVIDRMASALKLVSSEHGLDLYLLHHSHFPFATHIAAVEYLLNELIDASNAYKNDTARDQDELASQYCLRKELLTRYITLRSVGKMRRRFISQAFQGLFKKLQSLVPAEVIAARPAGPTLTDRDQNLILAIFRLAEFWVHEFPGLNEAITKPQGTASPPTMSWEFHQLLLRMLDLAQTKISTLPFHEIGKHSPSP
ncbi:hypothetical protein EV426DRAFT_704463 [Tirmania nivea]|nr:hypothetical protein EV426DRAFT_704463 [Tirmania nivea]